MEQRVPPNALWEYLERAKDVLLGCTSCLKTASTLSLNGRKFKVCGLIGPKPQARKGRNVLSSGTVPADTQATRRRGLFIRRGCHARARIGEAATE